MVVRVCREAGRLLYRVDQGHWCVAERDAARLIDRARDEYKLGIKLRDPDVDLRVTDELTEEARDVFSDLVDGLAVDFDASGVGVEDCAVLVDEVTALGRATFVARGYREFGVVVYDD